MLKQIDACVDCGKSPCFDCKEIVHICDRCGKEIIDVRYVVDSKELCNEELCKTCAKNLADELYEDMPIGEKLCRAGVSCKILK